MNCLRRCRSMTIPERRMRKHIYPGVGICIYCASDGGNLGLRNEHIVPGGLGGRLELPHASCHKCEKETHAFEGRVLGGIYGYSRVHLGVRREKKSKKNWPPTIPTTVSDDSGTSEIEVPVDLHPDLFRTIKWGPPEIFARIPPSDLGIQNATMDGMGDRDFWQRIARIGEGKRITLNQ